MQIFLQKKCKFSPFFFFCGNWKDFVSWGHGDSAGTKKAFLLKKVGFS